MIKFSFFEAYSVKAGLGYCPYKASVICTSIASRSSSSIPNVPINVLKHLQ